MQEIASDRQSNIVLACDFPFENPRFREKLLSRATRTLEAVSPYICSVKFNRHLVLPLGLFDGVQGLIEKVHEMGLLAIMDCKINDIGSTNQTIAQYYYAAGFDALTANPFAGWDEGLKPVFDVANRQNHGVILLLYMSHKGAKEGYEQTVYDSATGERLPQYVSFARKALKWNADGVVVGATYPEKIQRIHGLLGKKIPIFSPGVSTQGGTAESALNAGASYLIVGRAITLSGRQKEIAKRIRDVANQCKKPDLPS